MERDDDQFHGYRRKIPENSSTSGKMCRNASLFLGVSASFFCVENGGLIFYMQFLIFLPISGFSFLDYDFMCRLLSFIFPLVIQVCFLSGMQACLFQYCSLMGK